MSEAATEPGFMSHLVELRDRLLRSVLAVIIILIPLLFIQRELFEFLTMPIMDVLPKGEKLIAIDVAAPFLAPFKLAIFTAIFIAIPYLLYQAWAFVAPGLYDNERKLVVPLLFSSTLLFYVGIAFAYLIVFKLVFGFFYSIAPDVVSVTPDITSYLNFTLKMFFAFGICFEIPIATILLCWTGMTTPESLADKRRYVIVGVLVVAMLMTPPDVISQLLLGIPMYLLFEGGIFFARRLVPAKKADDDEEEEENSIMPAAAAAAATVATTETNAADHDSPAEAAPAAEQASSEPRKKTIFDDNEVDEPYVEPTDEELEAELDRIEAEEEDEDEEVSSSEPEAAENPEEKPKN